MVGSRALGASVFLVAGGEREEKENGRAWGAGLFSLLEDSPGYPLRRWDRLGELQAIKKKTSKLWLYAQESLQAFLPVLGILNLSMVEGPTRRRS